MDGFCIYSGTLFAVLVYYLEVRDIGSWMAVGNAVFVNCMGDMIIVLFFLYFLDSPI